MTHLVQTIFLSTPEQKARWKKATKDKPETVSSICRTALDKFAAKSERETREE